jgi:hypothetical protein
VDCFKRRSLDADRPAHEIASPVDSESRRGGDGKKIFPTTTRNYFVVFLHATRLLTDLLVYRTESVMMAMIIIKTATTTIMMIK